MHATRNGTSLRGRQAQLRSYTPCKHKQDLSLLMLPESVNPCPLLRAILITHHIPCNPDTWALHSVLTTTQSNLFMTLGVWMQTATHLHHFGSSSPLRSLKGATDHCNVQHIFCSSGCPQYELRISFWQSWLGPAYWHHRSPFDQAKAESSLTSM